MAKHTAKVTQCLYKVVQYDFIKAVLQCNKRWVQRTT